MLNWLRSFSIGIQCREDLRPKTQSRGKTLRDGPEPSRMTFQQRLQRVQAVLGEEPEPAPEPLTPVEINVVAVEIKIAVHPVRGIIGYVHHRVAGHGMGHHTVTHHVAGELPGNAPGVFPVIRPEAEFSDRQSEAADCLSAQKEGDETRHLRRDQRGAEIGDVPVRGAALYVHAAEGAVRPQTAGGEPAVSEAEVFICLQQLLQCGRFRDAVVIHDPDIFVTQPDRLPHAEREAAGSAEVFRHVEDPQIRLCVQPRGCPVRGVVIDHQDVGAGGLRPQGCDAALQQIQAVVGNDNSSEHKR